MSLWEKGQQIKVHAKYLCFPGGAVDKIDYQVKNMLTHQLM